MEFTQSTFVHMGVIVMVATLVANTVYQWMPGYEAPLGRFTPGWWPYSKGSSNTEPSNVNASSVLSSQVGLSKVR